MVFRAYSSINSVSACADTERVSLPFFDAEVCLSVKHANEAKQEVFAAQHQVEML